MALVQGSPFDELFARSAGVVPQAYLRSLAYKESGLRPDVVHPKSRATGLFQITQIALDSFNQRQKTALTIEHLKNPELNTQVAASHLAAVISVYRSYRSLAPNWASRRWVELLTLGWNAGHNAVARIAGFMESKGIPVEKVTAETVAQVAASYPWAKYVADPARVRWAKAVAEMFMNGGRIPSRGPLVATIASAGGSGIAALVGLAALGAAAFAFGKKEKR